MWIITQIIDHDGIWLYPAGIPVAGSPPLHDVLMKSGVEQAPFILYRIYNVLRGDTRVFSINTREYVSNSGHHRVDISFKPVLRLGKTDIYAFRIILEKNYERKRFADINGIIDDVMRKHEDIITERMKELGVRRIEYIAWRISRGYYNVMLVEPVDIIPTVILDSEVKKLVTALKIVDDIETAINIIFEKRIQKPPPPELVIDED